MYVSDFFYFYKVRAEMARRTKEEAQQTRCHIMSTALDLFSTHGQSKTSLTDIARAAELTRGARGLSAHRNSRIRAEMPIQDATAPISPNTRASQKATPRPPCWAVMSDAVAVVASANVELRPLDAAA